MDLSRLNPNHRRLVEWLVTPDHERSPATQKELAKEFGVHERTIRDWKEREDVRRAWAELSDKVVSDPTKIAAVVEKMRQRALDDENKQQVQAARTYLDYVRSVSPKATGPATPKDLSEFTDSELEAAIVERWRRGEGAAPDEARVS